MKNNKIIFINGLWSHSEAVLWIKNQLEKTTNIPFELFDYHDILIENI